MGLERIEPAIRGAQAPAPVSPAEDRARYTELVVGSTSAKKLVVAGPGAGKTYTFRETLRRPEVADSL